MFRDVLYDVAMSVGSRLRRLEPLSSQQVAPKGARRRGSLRATGLPLVDWMGALFAPSEETTTSAIARELSSIPLKSVAGMEGWFAYVSEKDHAHVNAPSPPEGRTKWWKDHMNRSILTYALRHQMHELVAGVERRRCSGLKSKLPGYL